MKLRGKSVGLTDNDKKLLNFIESYITAHGYPPTYKEMQEWFGLTTHWRLSEQIQRLREMGYIETDHPGSPRAIRLTTKVGSK